MLCVVHEYKTANLKKHAMEHIQFKILMYSNTRCSKSYGKLLTEKANANTLTGVTLIIKKIFHIFVTDSLLENISTKNKHEAVLRSFINKYFTEVMIHF